MTDGRDAKNQRQTGQISAVFDEAIKRHLKTAELAAGAGGVDARELLRFLSSSSLPCRPFDVARMMGIKILTVPFDNKNRKAIFRCHASTGLRKISSVLLLDVQLDESQREILCAHNVGYNHLLTKLGGDISTFEQATDDKGAPRGLLEEYGFAFGSVLLSGPRS